MDKVILVKFTYSRTQKTDIIIACTSHLTAERFIEDNEKKEEYQEGEWSLSDRELLS